MTTTSITIAMRFLRHLKGVLEVAWEDIFLAHLLKNIVGVRNVFSLRHRRPRALKSPRFALGSLHSISWPLDGTTFWFYTLKLNLATSLGCRSSCFAVVWYYQSHFKVKHSWHFKATIWRIFFSDVYLRSAITEQTWQRLRSTNNKQWFSFFDFAHFALWLSPKGKLSGCTDVCAGPSFILVLTSLGGILFCRVRGLTH